MSLEPAAASICALIFLRVPFCLMGSSRYFCSNCHWIKTMTSEQIELNRENPMYPEMALAKW
jgi:hypothetical protein